MSGVVADGAVGVSATPAQSRSHRRRGITHAHAAMTRPLITLLALVALATLARSNDHPRPRLIDFNPWAWLPTNRNRSPAIMDYFFPPSRTPKQSTLDTDINDKIDNPMKTTTTNQTPPPTTVEERSTTLARKVTNKTKSTVPATYQTATTTPKKKAHKTTPVPTTEFKIRTTQPPKTEPPTTKFTTTTAPTTYKPTKHYTVKQVRTTTETPTPSVEETETTSDSNSMETVDFNTSGTTASAEASQETVSTLTTASEQRSTETDTATSSFESTTPTDATPADGADSREGYLPLRDKPPAPQPSPTNVKINDQTKKETVPLPAGSTNVLAKPTKYHYYPHNQHIYLLPECAIQQVCNAVYVRLNYTQPLCACPSRYRDPCSASLNADDLHTTRLTTDSKKRYAKKAVTLVKTCEAVSEMRECRAPRDWSLLALQNIRTGKSHYLVICRCPESHILEGPMSHDQPTYASVPGIRVYGMMCVRPIGYSGYNPNRYTAAVQIQSTTSAYKVDYSQPHSYGDKPVYNRYQTPSYLDTSYYNRRSRVARVRRMAQSLPFPWHKVKQLVTSLSWD